MADDNKQYEVSCRIYNCNQPPASIDFETSLQDCLNLENTILAFFLLQFNININLDIKKTTFTVSLAYFI